MIWNKSQIEQHVPTPYTEGRDLSSRGNGFGANLMPTRSGRSGNTTADSGKTQRMAPSMKQEEKSQKTG